ncbi:hypothetical protein OZX57_04505 [Bifidobacterium sp. ESL0682]|uniref:hypothetical protein n=1 Tax=Bifidobacterium sp. ESL0682 TaxID=2983212 RepID=UPI0023F9223D|nr:hypothetical protein [Bifidobacterium sp. ESL0682]WEV41342.1 hypothetical protein OZX57_04505 [Bifidobacterium sp. ESL0682]
MRLRLRTDGAPKWIERLIPLIKKEIHAGADTQGNTTSKLNDTASNAKRNKNDGTFEATLIGRTLLTASASSKRVFNIKLQLNSAASWEPGDMVSVTYLNNEATVDDILSRVTHSGSTDLKANIAESLLTRDITKNGLALMKRYAQVGGNQQLLKLVADERAAVCWAKNHPVTSLFDEFPSDLALNDLMDIFTGKNSRLYSISNPCPSSDNIVELTVSEVRYSVCDKIRQGACSGYLAQAPIGSKIRISIVPDPHFHMPSDSRTPMIMVAFGSAIAPFRAFLKSNTAEERSSRPTWLIFGDRSPDEDFLYRDELEQWESGGNLTRLDTVWSRYGAKHHIQDALPEMGAELLRWLDAGAELYLCGHNRDTLQSVQEALQTSIAIAQANASAMSVEPNNDDVEWARAYMERLRGASRIHC